MDFCCVQLKSIRRKKRKMNASFSASAFLKFAQIWTPRRWGKFESSFAVGSLMFRVRALVFRFSTLALL